MGELLGYGGGEGCYVCSEGAGVVYDALVLVGESAAVVHAAVVFI